MFNGMDHLALFIGAGLLLNLTLGLSALLAAYLVCVGWTMLVVRAAKPASNATDLIAAPARPTGATGQNDLKKVFAKAFAPQFIAPEVPDKTLAFPLLALTDHPSH